MLIIKTSLNETATKGIGLFAREHIFKGGKVWVMDERFYRVYSEKEISEMPKMQQDFINKYGTWGVVGEGKFLDLDDTRFMNHSDNPNVLFVGNFGIALIEILNGEELTCDYTALGDERERTLKFLNLE